MRQSSKSILAFALKSYIKSCLKKVKNMNFLFASDSFKGSLSSAQTAGLLQKAADEVFPGCSCRSVTAADGGEGTLDAVLNACNGERITISVQGPLGAPVNASYGAISDHQAIIEMAAASGLPLIPESMRNPLLTSSYGTGQLIADAVCRGYTDISIAIGGSATNDGGMGCMRALGIRFLDSDGCELNGTGSDLEKIAFIDRSSLLPGIEKVSFRILCDVTNPLCGPLGATLVFGAQKGASPDILSCLEKGMCHYRDLLESEYDVHPDQLPGAGAAGGLGCALMVFLHGEMHSGIEQVLELIHFDELLTHTDLVVTGEGRTDAQSCHGKVLSGIGRHCLAKGIPVVALSGSLGEGADPLYQQGIDSVFTTVNAPMSLTEAVNHAQELYYDAALRMFRLLRAGLKLSVHDVSNAS